MSPHKPHRIVHPAWAQCLDARDVAAALRVAEGEGWPPLPRPALAATDRPHDRGANSADH